MDTNICFHTARDLAKAIKKRDLSAREVVETHLAQIKEINPQVNAIVSLNAEQALKDADKADEQLLAGDDVGPLHGLPIAIKDIHNAKGFPTTCGSLALVDNIATEDDVLVERLRAAGVIIIGKTNVPEFAAGAHTFNEVFGTTRNPYDLSRTAGGSSGGAAVAVASGMLPLADGSDMGGSLRYPAAFNNVVGFRPSPGRVPSYPKQALFSPLMVQGPIARNVADAALMMSIIAGPDDRSPISIEEPGSKFLDSLGYDLTGLRVAWTSDLGGTVPVDPAVRSTFEEQIKVFINLGCNVEEACPDFSDAEEIFQVLRAFEMELSYSDLFNRFQELMKPTFVWNLKKGRDLRGTDIGRAERLRHDLYHRMRNFFKKYDVLLLPVSQVPPFDGEIEYPQVVAGVKMESYIGWMQSCYYITVTGCPALSMPGGFTSDGLPFGLQIVGPHRSDFDVLRIGHAYEQATNYGMIRPKITEIKSV